MFLTGNVEVAARKWNSDELDYYSLPLPQFSDFTLPEAQNEEYENEARQNYILPWKHLNISEAWRQQVTYKFYVTACIDPGIIPTCSAVSLKLICKLFRL